MAINVKKKLKWFRKINGLCLAHKKSPPIVGEPYFLTEEEGFEPPVPCGTMVFKTIAISHSATPPVFIGKTCQLPKMLFLLPVFGETEFV